MKISYIKLLYHFIVSITFLVFPLSASIAQQEEIIDGAPSYFEEAPMNGWFCFECWDSSFEIGINGASGNSDNFNTRIGFDLERKTPVTAAKLGFDYSSAEVNGVDTQNFANLKLDLDRVFAEGSPWSLFLKTDLLWDEFRPFDLRLAINSGLGYKWVDNGATLFRTRTGAGVSREFGGVNNDWIPEAVFGLDFNHQLNDRQKLTATVDYLPSFEDFSDYRIVGDFSWEMLLHEATNMSLKLSVLDRYDSTPDGAEANDISYALLLLWKM